MTKHAKKSDHLQLVDLPKTTTVEIPLPPRIVYDHRQTVLDQYRTFESAIGDDLEAKNQFRLEIAKFIFSDPITGYVRADTGSELNINPVIGTIEKAIGGKGEA